MPKYVCHKQVWALKIARLQPTAGGLKLTPEATQAGPAQAGPAQAGPAQPEVGGYYVQYKDGYESFSPADAFEDGYTRVS